MRQRFPGSPCSKATQRTINRAERRMGGSPGCVGKLWHGNVSNVFGYQRKFCGTSQGKQYNSELVVFPHVTSSLSRNFLRMPLTIVLLHIVLALRICRCACCIACHIGPGCRLTFPLPGLRFGERSLCAPSEFGLARSEGNPSSPMASWSHVEVHQVTRSPNRHRCRRGLPPCLWMKLAKLVARCPCR